MIVRYNKKAQDLPFNKKILLIILAVVLLFVSLNLSAEIFPFVGGSLYQSTVENCKLEEEMGVTSGTYCYPINCDQEGCSEEEEDRWDRLKSGFESSSCYHEREECDTEFEKRMYDLVHGEEGDFTVPEDFSPLEFKNKVDEVAENLGAEAYDLLAVIHFETAGTFNPCIGNPRSSATGLIQFTEASADDLGVTTEYLCSLSSVDQMDYVEEYLDGIAEDYNVEYSSLDNLYAAVLCPGALETGVVATDLNRDDIDHERGACNLEDSNDAYEYNKGLDLNEDGKITVDEASKSISSRVEIVQDYDWETTQVS